MKKEQKENPNVIDGLNEEIYLLDEQGKAHLVILTAITFKDNGFELTYKSSSDLESRGLEKHLKDVVERLYIKGEKLDE